MNIMNKRPRWGRPSDQPIDLEIETLDKRGLLRPDLDFDPYKSVPYLILQIIRAGLNAQEEEEERRQGKKYFDRCVSSLKKSVADDEKLFRLLHNRHTVRHWPRGADGVDYLSANSELDKLATDLEGLRVSIDAGIDVKRRLEEFYLKKQEGAKPLPKRALGRGTPDPFFRELVKQTSYWCFVLCGKQPEHLGTSFKNIVIAIHEMITSTPGPWNDPEFGYALVGDALEQRRAWHRKLDESIDDEAWNNPIRAALKGSWRTSINRDSISAFREKHELPAITRADVAEAMLIRVNAFRARHGFSTYADVKEWDTAMNTNLVKWNLSDIRPSLG